jgi:hypothetical protein
MSKKGAHSLVAGKIRIGQSDESIPDIPHCGHGKGLSQRG